VKNWCTIMSSFPHSHDPRSDCLHRSQSVGKPGPQAMDCRQVLGNGDRKPRTVSSCKSTERRSQRPLQYLGMNARVFVNNCERTCEFVLSHLQHSARPTAPGISLRSRLCYIDAKHLPSIDALPRERSPQCPMKMHAATFAHTAM
jgi:hypothetical protein